VSPALALNSPAESQRITPAQPPRRGLKIRPVSVRVRLGAPIELAVQRSISVKPHSCPTAPERTPGQRRDSSPAAWRHVVPGHRLERHAVVWPQLVARTRYVPGMDKPTVVIRPSLRAAFHPKIRQDAHELVAELASDDRNVVLQLPDPGHFSVQNSLESIGIYIAGTVSGTALTLLVTDLHDGARAWLVKRFKKGKNTDAQFLTIYGPDNTPLKQILARNADHIVDMTPRPKDDDGGQAHGARRHD
jgi:hypothetical protein